MQPRVVMEHSGHLGSRVVDSAVSMPPPGFPSGTKPRLKPRRVESGESAPGLPIPIDGPFPAQSVSGECTHGVGNSADPPSEAFLLTTGAPERTHKKISPADVRSNAQASLGADRIALGDAEALWHMCDAPVYGDPEFPEEEFSAAAIRFTQR